MSKNLEEKRGIITKAYSKLISQRKTVVRAKTENLVLSFYIDTHFIPKVVICNFEYSFLGNQYQHRPQHESCKYWLQKAGNSN